MSATQGDRMSPNHIRSKLNTSLFDLSVCIVNHKHRNLLAACLDSLAHNLEGRRARVVVLDNNSQDGSIELLRKYYPYVKVLENTRTRGFAANQNTMLKQEMERSRYVMMLNDDTIMQTGCIEQLIDFLDNHSRVGAIAAQLQFSDGRLQVSATAFPSIWKELWRYLGIGQYMQNDRLKRFLAATLGRWGNREIREYLVNWGKAEPREMDALCGGALMFRSKALFEVGLLNEDYIMYVEDVDWCRRAWKLGWECWILPSARVIHCRGASSSVFTFIEMERSILRYFALYHRNSEVVTYRFFLLVLTLLKATLLPFRWLFCDRKTACDLLAVYHAAILLAYHGLAPENN